MADWIAPCGPKSIGMYKSDLTTPPDGLVDLVKVDDQSNGLVVYTEDVNLAGEHEVVYVLYFKYYPTLYKVSTVIKVTV